MLNIRRAQRKGHLGGRKDEMKSAREMGKAIHHVTPDPEWR